MTHPPTPTPTAPSTFPACRRRAAACRPRARRAWLVLAASLATGALAGGEPPDDAASRFAAFCQSQAAAAQERGDAVVEGLDGWLFLTAELRHLGLGPFWGDAAAAASSAPRESARDPLPAILETAAQLRERGIALLLVPVPPRAAIYPDKLWPDAPPGARLDRELQAFYRVLDEAGVAVLDLAGPLSAARATDAADGPLYCRQDSHWSPRGIALAADVLAARLRELVPELPPPPAAPAVRPRSITIDGDLWRLLARPELPRESLTLLELDAPPPALAAPVGLADVLLLADSHGLVFHAGGDLHAEGGGLSDHLAARLGRPVKLIARRGSAATAVRVDLARRVRADPAAAERLRVVVWCFAAREFTETSGWRSVPIFP